MQRERTFARNCTGPAARQPLSRRAPEVQSSLQHGEAARATSSTFGASVNEKNFMLRSQYTVSNLLAFSGKGQITDKEDFKRQVESIRDRIKTLRRR